MPVLKTVFLFFVTKYLRGNDIHVVTRALTKDTRVIIMNAFFSALAFLRAMDVLSNDDYTPPTSALFAAAHNGSAKIFAIFGGQGNIEEYFDELADIYTTYTTLVQDYIEDMAAVLRDHARSEDASVFHSKGLDVMGWLRNPDSKPDVAYLVSAPVSLPLIGLVQLMHYYVMLKVHFFLVFLVFVSFLSLSFLLHFCKKNASSTEKMSSLFFCKMKEYATSEKVE